MKDPAKNKLKNKSSGPERTVKNVPGQAGKSGGFSSLLKKEGVRSVIASVVCVLGGILVGFIVLLLLSIFAENVSVGEAFSGIAIVLGGPFSGGSGRDILFQLGNMLFQSAPLIMTGLSVALALSRRWLGGRGACRVHGGGFGGTMQAFVPNDFVSKYQERIEAVFGKNTCHVLKIRPFGSVLVER